MSRIKPPATSNKTSTRPRHLGRSPLGFWGPLLMTNLLACWAHIMGCASAVDKTRRGTDDWQDNWRLGRDFETLWPLSGQFSALLQCPQNVIGCRKIATVPGNPVKLRHAAITHSLIQIHLTASRYWTPSLASRSSVTRPQVERCFRSSGSPWNPFQYGARLAARLHSIRQSVGRLRHT